MAKILVDELPVNKSDCPFFNNCPNSNKEDCPIYDSQNSFLLRRYCYYLRELKDWLSERGIWL